MKVSEIFRSLQGEGVLIGTPTVFIRMIGCNLECSWCDTEYSREGGEELSIEQIMAELDEHKTQFVCLTGGEPLMQKDIIKLLDKLVDKCYHVTLETNGSLPLEDVPCSENMLISMDIKCPSSGEQSKMLFGEIKHLSEVDQLKFVIETDGDYEYAKSVILKYRPRCSVIFQPVWGSEMKTLAGKILDDGLDVRLIPQLHKLIWGEKEIGI